MDEYGKSYKIPIYRIEHEKYYALDDAQTALDALKACGCREMICLDKFHLAR